MIPGTFIVVAFGVAMLRPPTHHEGWALSGGQVRSILREGRTEHEFRVGDAVPLPSQISSYLANDLPIDPVDWLKSELAAYCELAVGWDGPRSIPPNAEHVRDAERFISLLPPGLPLPKPMLSPSGEVAFYWRTDANFADAVMEGSGRFSLFVRSQTPTAMEQFLDDIQISEVMGATLLAAFERARHGQTKLQ